MKKLRNDSSPSQGHHRIEIPRGTPPQWLTRWQLAATLRDRLEMMEGGVANSHYMFRLALRSRSYLDLIRRYSNDSML